MVMNYSYYFNINGKGQKGKIRRKEREKGKS